jgi:hypothetical protein
MQQMNCSGLKSLCENGKIETSGAKAQGKIISALVSRGLKAVLPRLKSGASTERRVLTQTLKAPRFHQRRFPAACKAPTHPASMSELKLRRPKNHLRFRGGIRGQGQ